MLSLADLEAFDPRPQGRDPEKVYKCPLCQSDERALHVNTATGVFNCKRASCGAKGKLSDFCQERPKQNRAQRKRNILQDAFSLDTGNRSPTAENAVWNVTERKKTTTSTEPATATKWRELFADAQPLVSTPAAQNYLAQRGLSEMVTANAGVRALNLRGRGFVVFPFCDVIGAPVAFQARAIDTEPNGHRAYGPKSAGVFATCADAFKTEIVIITEAPIDALSLAVCGYSAIALGGTAAPEWLATALAFKRVYLAFDNDSNGAGDNAAAAIEPALRSFGAKTARLAPRRAPDADKSDWNMMLREHGARSLGSWLKARFAHIGHFDMPGRPQQYAMPQAQIISDEEAEQIACIRALSADVSAQEVLAAYARIKPPLKAQLSQSDLHKLALQLAHAGAEEKQRPIR